MKKVLLLAVIFIASVSVFAQNPPTGSFDLTNYGVKIEPDKRLMVVMASLEAAGLDTPLTAEGENFRQKLKTDLLGMDVDLRRKMVVFIEQYKRRHPKATNAEIVAPFVSMAYTLAPVPDLSDPIRASDLPGDLLEVLDFAPLVREFYRKAYSAKLDEYLKDYQSAGSGLKPSTNQMVGDLLDYLHTKPQLTYIDRIKTQTKDAKGKKTFEKTEIRERSRRFYIVPEMLAPKETINFRNIGDDYFAIVPPNTNLTTSEVRRAYLQFVIDPLVLSNGKDISTVREPIKTLLDERRKENPDVSPDVFLAVTRSLIAAVDARQIESFKVAIATEQARRKIDQMKTVEEKKAVSAELNKFKESLADETALQLSEAYEKGAVLAFYFADQLKGFEDSGFDIAGSMREFVLSLDATKETNRLTQYADARKRATAAREERRKNGVSQEIIIENPVTKRLLEIDQFTKAKNYTESEKQLKLLLETNPSESRIYYALGRVASLSAESITDTEARKRRLLEAKNAYENVVRSATPKTDPALISLAYVALARIYEFYGETAYAIKIYEAAMKVGNVPDGAYNEAKTAREKLIKEQ
jgi:tetratricopeptide (TPR) repeat protein